MFDSYIILNRKPKIIIIIFVYVLICFSFYLLYLSNTLIYTSYYCSNSTVINVDNEYYLKMIVELDKLNLVTKKKRLYFADSNNQYNYQVYKIEEGINNDSKIVYLKVFEIDNSYKINNYGIKIKIKEKSTKLINYIKN